MRGECRVAVIIPAFNEEAALGQVIAAIPEWVDDIIVADNGSTDRTAEVARAAGARVVHEPRRGYGSACLAGMAALGDPDVVVFLDGDFSDHPDEMDRLVDPIRHGHVDMVIGSRVLGTREPGALTPQARFGNWLACLLMRLFWRARHTDLGPFRAIRAATLRQLQMRDPDYGWTVEMQVKAARRGVRVREVPVSYRRRIGASKISGTVKGVIGAGTKILGVLLYEALRQRPPGGTERLIVFTRYPEPGKTKTRLIPALGPEGAAALQQEMTAHTLGWAAAWRHGRSKHVEVRHEGGDLDRMRASFGRPFAYRPQSGGDLGARMAGAFADAFNEGAERVVIVGTDCPDLSADLARQAFDAMSHHDLVLGPTSDGGYYLIGLTRPTPELLRGIRWSTDVVLQQTLRIARRLGLSIALLHELDDVDRPDDLDVWRRAEAGAAESVSVIIPTLDEADEIDGALDSALCGPGTEVIVVDGGSRDDTVRRAAARGVRVLTTEPGRAVQMNAGARAARGDLLLFLHADTRLPSGYAAVVRQALAEPDVTLGAFRLLLDAPGKAFRLIERLIQARSERLGTPYGDQALFVRKAVFASVGGFPEMPIMEDFQFVRRLRRRGRVAIAPVPVVTSARRWQRVGVWKQTWINQAAMVAHRCGIATDRIARWYHARS